MSDSTKTGKDAAGKALYLEFRKENYTYQLVLLPDSLSLDKQTIRPARLMSRRVTSWHPRRNWAFTGPSVSSELNKRDHNGDFELLMPDEAKNFAASRIVVMVQSLLHTFRTRGYSLYKHPLFVEFSYDEAESVSNSNTPNTLYRRILRNREAFGWGSEVFVEPVSA